MKGQVGGVEDDEMTLTELRNLLLQPCDCQELRQLLDQVRLWYQLRADYPNVPAIAGIHDCALSSRSVNCPMCHNTGVVVRPQAESLVRDLREALDVPGMFVGKPTL
jgi:hypothetical protein